MKHQIIGVIQLNVITMLIMTIKIIDYYLSKFTASLDYLHVGYFSILIESSFYRLIIVFLFPIA
jgi:hypothetical protein